MAGRLEGKVAIITGAAGGQGAADAHAFAREGCSLILTDLDTRKGEELARSIQVAGGAARFVEHDVSRKEDWARVADRARSAFGGLHVLVNNAGITTRRNLMASTLEDWNRTIAVNLTGPLLGIQACAPLMAESGGGSIINVSSTAAFMAHYDTAYGVSKWGLRGLSKSAAIDLVDWNIRVNSIHPGHVANTSFSREALAGHAESIVRSVPMKRAALPEECAELVLFLAGDESSYITGCELVIDGGYLAGGSLIMRNRIRAEVAERAGEAGARADRG